MVRKDSLLQFRGDCTVPDPLSLRRSIDSPCTPRRVDFPRHRGDREAREEELMRHQRVCTLDPLGPDELKLIEGIFRRELQLRALPLNSEEAAILAARLIGAYQSGIRDAAGLAAAAERM